MSVEYPNSGEPMYSNQQLVGAQPDMPMQYQDPNAVQYGVQYGIETPVAGTAENPIDYSQSADRYQYDPNFKGYEVNRQCTDICMLVTFIVFLCSMLALFIAALTKSFVSYLYLPTDYHGYLCGYDNREFANSTDPALDLRDKKYLFWLRPGVKGYVRSACVKSCPTEGLYEEIFADMMSSTYHDENYKCKTSSGNAIIKNPYVASDSKFSCPYQTKEMLLRCLPTMDAVNKNESLAKEIADSMSDINVLANAVNDIRLTYYHIIIFIIAALLLSVGYLLLLRVSAGFFIWLTVILALAAMAFLTYECWLQTTDKATLDIGIEAYTMGLLGADTNQKTFKVFFYILIVIDVILLLLVIFLYKRINISIGIIKVVSRVFGSVPTLFLFPMIIYLIMFIWLVYVVGVCVVLFGAGSFEHTFPEQISGEINVGSLEFNYDTVIEGFSIYHIIGSLWVLIFINALGKMTIAGVFASYYFVREPRRENMPTSPVWDSFKRSLRYHIGTLAAGSLIITIFTVIRAIIAYIEKETKKYQNKFINFLVCCCKCCFNCLDCFMKYLTTNCYIATSIHGYNFFEGCKRAFSLLARNPARAATLNAVGDFSLFLSRIFVSTITTACSLAWFYTMEDLTYAIFPSIFVFLGSFVVSGAFTSLFEMGIDSMFFCFIEDEERNDNSPGRERFAPDDLKEYMDDANK